MKFAKFTACTAAAMIGTLSITVSQQAHADSMAHAHMGHVTTSWKDTPEKAGLLPTAIQEAEIAIQHAGFAAQKADNLKWMKTHIKHVLHAIDATAIAKGPGKGYGVKKAATGVAKHIGFAAASKDASENVQTHAVHVAMTADNTVARVADMVALAKQVDEASSAEQAAPLVMKIEALAGQLLEGADGNGDGKISWHKGEGGLMEAKKHMGFMRKGEKL